MTESAQQALLLVRRVDSLQWYVIPLLVLVAYVYVVEVQRRNFSAVYLGLGFWAGEFIWEMFNALILHFTDYAPLWSTPGKSAFVIYAGLNIEISFFFGMSAVMLVKSLPENRDLKIAGISNRALIPIGCGILAALVEVVLNRAHLLIWDWWFWRWPHIYLIVLAYCAPSYLVVWCHDHLPLSRKRRAALILIIAAVVCHLVFATYLGWI